MMSLWLLRLPQVWAMLLYSNVVVGAPSGAQCGYNLKHEGAPGGAPTK